MGSMCDCFRDPQSSGHESSSNVITPDTETRRIAAAEAANRRYQQTEKRGVDEDEYRRLKQRQIERERLEQQQAKQPKSSDEGGLRWQMS